jgi:hypothetical protein
VTVAEDGPADGAVEAVTALRPEREDHMVAGFHCGDAGTDVLDDAGRLVAEHHRQRKRPVPVDDVPVAVADPGRLDLDSGLAGLGIILLDIYDLKPSVDLVKDGRFHGLLPSLGWDPDCADTLPVRSPSGQPREHRVREEHKIGTSEVGQPCSGR